jgi:hypothetical protein
MNFFIEITKIHISLSQLLWGNYWREMTNFKDIEDAYDFVNFDSYGINRAILRKDTGKILYQSELANLKEIEIAEDMLNDENCIEIPHKNDLDLGQYLVFDFMREYLPAKLELVNNFFYYPGAYSNYKALLESEGLLQTWHDFENSKQREALLQWCKKNGIELEYS